MKLSNIELWLTVAALVAVTYWVTLEILERWPMRDVTVSASP